ncbi:MAG: DNA-directed RNA polymerase subunit alpha [Patescibacteria group bacterium]
MEYQYLSETVTIKKISETNTEGVFEVEGLYTGYGLTVGNALRRVLLSSLPGAAITQIKIKGVSHEFSTLPGVKEDMVELALNCKKIRFRIHTDEPQVLTLKVKGEKTAAASDIKVNSQVELITPDVEIAHLTSKDAELDMEITVEKGLGYVPTEARRSDKLPIGVIAIDALFSPVVKVNLIVENMRVGERADYNRLRLLVTTDGSITPSSALHKSCNILQDHFSKISQVEVKELEKMEAPAEEKKAKKAAKEKKTAKKSKK